MFAKKVCKNTLTPKDVRNKFIKRINHSSKFDNFG